MPDKVGWVFFYGACSVEEQPRGVAVRAGVRHEG